MSISTLIDTNISGPVASLTAKVITVLFGTMLITSGAYAEVPMWPVPMTLQSLAVLCIGGMYGFPLAAITVATYLAQGALGLPVFSGGQGGIMHLFGPTGGYLFGFLAAAAAMSYLADRCKWDKSYIKIAVNVALGTLCIFLPGILWLSGFTGFEQALVTGLIPFFIGLLLKGFLAWTFLAAKNV